MKRILNGCDIIEEDQNFDHGIPIKIIPNDRALKQIWLKNNNSNTRAIQSNR